jgi:hypothetical protein
VFGCVKCKRNNKKSLELEYYLSSSKIKCVDGRERERREMDGERKIDGLLKHFEIKCSLHYHHQFSSDDFVSIEF